MTNKIDVVFYDFGGVFTAAPFPEIERFGEELGTAPGQIASLMFGPYSEDTDHPWHQLERGEIPFTQAREAIMQLASGEGLEFDPLQVLMRMGTDRESRNLLIQQVRSLRAQGTLTALITNNILEFREAWRSLLPVEELFVDVIDSSEVGMRKPNPEIFHLALKRLGDIAPERSLFLDDYPGNIDAARSIGMQGILVGEDESQTVRAIDEIMGLQL
jgi:epoxide hydrolase-like predicted phosphatase